MKIDMEKRNAGFESILENRRQTIFLDANFFIPPDRTSLGARKIDFIKYREIWLEPLFEVFSNLAIHESVYAELVAEDIRSFADEKRMDKPSKLRVYFDTELNAQEKALMQTYIYNLAPYSKYIPERNNADDRGEVRSISYMAVKKFLYFAANDNLPYQLICNAECLHTGLDEMGLLQMYEMIFYLYREGKYDSKGLRLLYKYQYFLTRREKAQNPEWGMFVEGMKKLYG